MVQIMQLKKLQLLQAGKKRHCSTTSLQVSVHLDRDHLDEVHKAFEALCLQGNWKTRVIGNSLSHCHFHLPLLPSQNLTVCTCARSLTSIQHAMRDVSNPGYIV